MYLNEDFTILDKPHASLVAYITDILGDQGIRSVIVGGIATQLNIIYSEAERAGLVSKSGVMIDLLEGTGISPTPIIYGSELDLEGKLRPTHDLDLCCDNADELSFLTAFTQAAATDRSLEVRFNAMKENGYRKISVSRRFGKSNSELIRLGLDYNVCADDSHARIHRDEEAYGRVMETARTIDLKLGKVIYSLTFVRPEEIVASKIVRGKDKDMEDILLLLEYVPFDLDEVKRILDRNGEQKKYSTIRRMSDETPRQP